MPDKRPVRGVYAFLGENEEKNAVDVLLLRFG